MDMNSAVLIVSTDVGPIALSIDDMREARLLALHILGKEVTNASVDLPEARLVDADKIAELFHMDATWFLCRAREKRIPHIRLGKYVRFDPAEIREFFHQDVDRHAC